MSPPPLAATAAPADAPASLAAAPSLTGKRRGNPDLGLALRCGARTRAGCPCRAPAIHGKLRCRMHGGRSTGPRTAEGMARLRRGRVGNEAVRYVDRLPADLVGRLMQMPPELMPPPCPSGGLTPAEDRAVLRAEAEALAPWREAIAQAQPTGRAGRARSYAAAGGRSGAQAGVHAPVPPHRDPAGAEDAAGGALADGVTKAHTPDRVADADAGAEAASPTATASPTAPVPIAPMTAQARAHAPEHAADMGRGAATAPLAAHGGAMQRQAEAHAPEGSPAAGGTIPAAGTNRAARRRLKHLQKRS
jgi:hypothetical protein